MCQPLPAADRAHLLAWLSSVFLHEPDAEFVGLLGAYESDRAVASLDAVPTVAAEARAMLAALRDLLTREGSEADAALALAGRYGTLFLGAGGPMAAHPYASIYEEGRTHGTATQRTAAFLAIHGLGVCKDVQEPADHLGIQLAALAALAEREAESTHTTATELRETQAMFAKSEMCPWLVTFRDRVIRDDPDGYYAAAARLTEIALGEFYAPTCAG